MKQVSNNTLLTALVIIGLVALAGLVYPKSAGYPTIPTAGTAGDTQSTPKQVQVEAYSGTDTSVASTTPASFYNSHTNARIISEVFTYCEGLTSTYTAKPILQLYVGTTTAANGTTTANYLLRTDIASSSPGNFFMSSTTGVSVGSRYWAPGEYLNFTFNATSTAECAMGVKFYQL